MGCGVERERKKLSRSRRIEGIFAEYISICYLDLKPLREIDGIKVFVHCFLQISLTRFKCLDQKYTPYATLYCEQSCWVQCYAIGGSQHDVAQDISTQLLLGLDYIWSCGVILDVGRHTEEY